MATTCLMPLHVGGRWSVSSAIRHSVDYVENPLKTDGGKYVHAYACDAGTAASEFYLASKQYKNVTGRTEDGVIAYHLRQAFKPGEITTEEANEIGRELAMKLTKGRYAFIVCTHVDKGHIHNHIIFNSVDLSCERKFKNFWGSTRAIRRMSDRLCLEHGLSVVENPQRGGAHYGSWLGDSRKIPYAEQLRRAIDAVLEMRPADFEEFVRGLEETGITVSREGKYLRLKMPGQERFTRCDTLKGGYTEQAIRERIDGKRAAASERVMEERPAASVGLLINVEAAVRSGKGPGYERWAKVFNLKQLSQAVIYLKEHGDMSYEKLREKCVSVTDDFNRLSGQIKELEAKMKANGELQKQIVNYAKTRVVYAEYKKSGYSKKYRAEHEGDILLHQVAKKHFDSVGITKLPSVRDLREEYADLLAQKKKAYAAYKRTRADMKELYNVKANMDYLLGTPDAARTGKKIERA